jgi:predicted nucleic acid-binding protein
MKWFLPEIHSEDALRYLDPDLERDAPELLLAEASNILWKKVTRGELTAAEADIVAESLEQADVNIHRMGSLFAPALRLAIATGRSAYDCTYLALSETLSTRLVTADRRLYNALQGGPYAGLVLWVEDGP